MDSGPVSVSSVLVGRTALCVGAKGQELYRDDLEGVQDRRPLVEAWIGRSVACARKPLLCFS